MSAEALNCPNCGAGVSSDSSRCIFCKTRLKTIACPSCFGMMFAGTAFCGHCGAIAAPVEMGEGDELGDCPRCREPLELLDISGNSLRSCAACDGLWADAVTFETICANREEQSAVLGHLLGRTRHPMPMTKVNYVPCPDCGQLMNRNNFAKASGVIVDICKGHGIWFDSDELHDIVRFIHKGGMELARQRERNEIEHERQKLRDERLAGSISQGRAIGGVQRDEEYGTRAFVRRLFGIE